MQPARRIFENKERLSLEQAKRQVCLLYYSDLSRLQMEGINNTFFPQLAIWAKFRKPDKSALEVIQETFLDFDIHAQQREAKILEKYLNQLGS